jgi:hypothetical protein
MVFPLNTTPLTFILAKVKILVIITASHLTAAFIDLIDQLKLMCRFPRFDFFAIIAYPRHAALLVKVPFTP